MPFFFQEVGHFGIEGRTRAFSSKKKKGILLLNSIMISMISFSLLQKKKKNERDLLYLLGYYQMDLDPQNRFSVVSSSQVLETSPSAELLEKSRHSYYVCYIKLFSSIAISHIKYKLKTFYILSV